jgi:hypothetical protein
MSGQPYKKPQPYYFISYCREEVTFVDSLADELEKRGINTWVDIRDLIPGTGWQKQLDDGVENAEGILLVVSKESMKSRAVTDEWTKAINKWNKPVTLLIFEPAKIPDAILNLKPKWVDFTSNFNKALDQLILRLSQTGSIEQESQKTPPQKGKKLPMAVLIFIILSTVLFFLAWKGQWASYDLVAISIGVTGEEPTVPIPLSGASLFAAILSALSFMILMFNSWQFIQVPWRVFKRKHNAEKIRNVLYAVVFINIAAFFVHIFYAIKSPDTLPQAAVNLLFSFGLLYLLNTKEMYRWAGATGAIIKSPNPDISGHTDNGEPKLVGIEYAPQDRLYVEALKDSVTKAGHIIAEDLQKAEVILCLLSAHKTDSAFNPQEKELYPILLQRCNVSEKLSQVQWIDMRHGKASMDAVANLLDEPHELIRILGVLPVRTNILPLPVKVALNLFSVLFAITGFFYAVNLFDALVSEDTVLSNTQKYLPVIILLGIYLLRKYITDRILRFLPSIPYKWVLGFAIILACAVTYIYMEPGFEFDWLTLTISLPYWLMPAAILHKEIRFWLPAK